jgi:predicted nucleic acid-binding protein
VTRVVVDASALAAVAFNEPGADEVAMLAISTNLTAFDASYVWLAGMLGADLVTLDEKIGRATRDLAV